jgi:hypothetical protein
MIGLSCGSAATAEATNWMLLQKCGFARPFSSHQLSNLVTAQREALRQFWSRKAVEKLSDNSALLCHKFRKLNGKLLL